MVLNQLSKVLCFAIVTSLFAAANDAAGEIGSQDHESSLSLKRMGADCEQSAVDVVYDKFGRHDETFSVFGYTIIYENHYNGLAVVRTSDEVEPRDVLISYEKPINGRACKVDYREILADGMVADLDDVLIELKQSPTPISKKYFLLKGTVHSVLSGEIHPFVLGDACVIEVRDEEGKLTALVADVYDCDENPDVVKVGRQVEVQLHKSDKMNLSKAEKDELSDLFESQIYYQVQFQNLKFR